jgi:outer membrane protein OmpA-like peptidoglycan-associated protein
MRYPALLLHTFLAAGLAVTLGAVFISEAHAAETVNSAYTATAKPKVNAESLETYTMLALDRVYFNYERSDLSAKEKKIVDAALVRFSSTPQAVIELRGYEDGMESGQSETALGNARSEVIAQYLTAHGVPSSRIVSVPTEGTSGEDRSANPEHRRVDVRVFAAPGSIAGSMAGNVQLSSLRERR